MQGVRWSYPPDGGRAKLPGRLRVEPFEELWMRDWERRGQGWSRRQVLGSGLALAMFAAAWPIPALGESVPDRLPEFLELSRRATGFDDLDPALGRRYLQALLEWEPRLVDLLRFAPPDLSTLQRHEQALVDLMIECWYTGTVPTARGTAVVSASGALGDRCLPRDTPVSFCRG